MNTRFRAPLGLSVVLAIVVSLGAAATAMAQGPDKAQNPDEIEESIAALMVILTDEKDAGLRPYAAAALGKIPRAAPHLSKVLLDEKHDISVWYHAAFAIRQIAAEIDPKHRPDVTKALINALKLTEKRVRLPEGVAGADDAFEPSRRVYELKRIAIEALGEVNSGEK